MDRSQVMKVFAKALERILEKADIKVNGNRPWDIRLRDLNYFNRLESYDTLKIGNGYLRGDWECDALDVMVSKLLQSGELDAYRSNKQNLWYWCLSRLFSPYSEQGSKRDIGFHYDIGNSFYQQMLDPLMIYSCGYWHQAADLADAQRKKLDLICRKLDLKHGQMLLDIGCGWGGLLSYAAEHYGVHGTGVTLSKEQYEYARHRYAHLPINFVQADYRHILGNQTYDRIVSVGMLEHVGSNNYELYFSIANQLLAKNGIALIHTIGRNERGSVDPWIHNYVFPNGYVPALSELSQAIEKTDFVLEDLHNIGPHYDRTLMEWWSNIRPLWDREDMRGRTQQKRQWQFYLQTCAGTFRARDLQVWQLLLTHKGRTQPEQARSI
ncbi:cyclopropane-fatty-acyl-phospholipid synthase (plasmid) [Vibrio coralliilyticus]|uniref:Cyclopropane-fatty-acyl-phospholipid synthase n=1 Tax=Vibrio coralliilyticus TaxID=190893 RepID=A0AAN0W0T4_9VIBR|nr:cyclopropane-fatty-acyl-phospholipid synthase [Vibrio coralliilyticus]